MRKFLLLTVFLSILAPATVENLFSAPNAKEPSGIMGIKFGAAKDEAINSFIEKYHLQSESGTNEYIGDNGFTLRVFDDFLFTPDYCLSDSCFDLYLFFGKSDRLYSYMLKTKGLTANHFDTTLSSDTMSLSEMFQGEFGAPAEKQKPGFFDVKQGLDVIFWRWRIPDFEIYTALTVNNAKYQAIGKVVSRKFEAKEKTLNAKQEKK